MKNIIKIIWQGFTKVFGQPKYIILVVIILILMVIFFIYLPINQLLWIVLTNDVYDFIEKIKVFYFSLGSFVTNFNWLSRTTLITVSLFTSVNITMLVYYLKRRIKKERSNGVGYIGTVFGVLGVGCASCGSVILSTIFGISATTTLVGILPLRGLEIGLLGIGLISISIYFLSKKIINPDVCKIN